MELFIARSGKLSQLKCDYAALRVQVSLLKLELAYDRALKAEAQTHPTTHYIWRTRGDNKVRASHAANNGKLFSWDSPPPTGHPGEDYGCRCTAEPYARGKSELAYQTLISGMQDSPNKWGNVAFSRHFYLGEGAAVTLGETGNFKGIVDFYFYRLGKYNDVNAQIIEEARKHPAGSFEYPFRNSYAFSPYLFVLGDATVSGKFRGFVQRQDEMLSISGTVEYVFEDIFTDPSGERQEVIGTSDPAAATQELLDDTEYGGTYYAIEGEWQTSFRSEAKVDAKASHYKWD